MKTPFPVNQGLPFLYVSHNLGLIFGFHVTASEVNA